MLVIGYSDDVDLEEDDEASVKPVNPLSALDDRFNQEKDALLAQLRGELHNILYKLDIYFIASPDG